MKRRAYTWKSKLSILEEFDVDGTSLKSVARKHDLSPKCLRRWRQQRSGVMTTVSILCDSTSRHQFLNRRSLHPGRKPKTINSTLGIILKMYRDLRDQDRVVTLNLLAAELKRLDPGARNVTMPALRRRINRHLIKFGVVRRRVTRVAQNTRHDMTVKAGYVAFVNEGIKAGKYRACDIVNIDETNIDFDLVSGATLAGRGDRTVACATTGSSNRCTVMLGVTMDGEKLPPFVIFKGANTSRSKIMKEFDSVESRSKFGYPEGMFYTVQAKAWMDKARMHDWIDTVWSPYTKDTRRGGRDTYLLMDEFSVHLMGEINHKINKLGTETEFVPGGYTGCVQVLDKGVNKPFKHYAREEFESWMVSNGSRKKPTRGEVSQWIKMAWDKVTTATIINSWKSIGHKAGDEEDDETIIQNDQQVEDEQGGQEEQDSDYDDGGDLPLEEEPLFRWSNLMEVTEV
jgi:hypothetical protein